MFCPVAGVGSVGVLSAAMMIEDDVDVDCCSAVTLKTKGKVAVDVDSVITSSIGRGDVVAVVVVVPIVVAASSLFQSGSCLISTLMSKPAAESTAASTSESRSEPTLGATSELMS